MWTPHDLAALLTAGYRGDSDLIAILAGGI
jgi:hypothetical protein